MQAEAARSDLLTGPAPRRVNGATAGSPLPRTSRAGRPTLLIASGGDPEVEPLTRALSTSFVVVPVDDYAGPAVDRGKAGPALLARVGPGYQSAGMLETISSRLAAPALALLKEEDLVIAHSSAWSDFVLYPWRVREVVVRVYRLVEKADSDGMGLLRWGHLVLDPARHEVRAQQGVLDLTYTEFRILRFLMARGGRVCTREAILKEVWGEEHFGGLRTVDVHVRRLRSKLESRRLDYVGTVRSVGYRMNLPESPKNRWQ